MRLSFVVPLSVVAVILSAAKDPDAARSAKTVGTFQPIKSACVHDLAAGILPLRRPI
jgi:hypothetical protein